MFLVIAFALLIGFFVYYYFKPNIVPKNKAVQYRPATENSSPVYRREGVNEFKTTLDNSINPNSPITTLYELGEYAFKKYAKENCLGTRSLVRMHTEDVIVDGKSRSFTYPELSEYQWKTYAEVHKEVTYCGAGLRSIGMEPGDFFAIFEDTCYEWTIASRGCFTQSITIFTVYANLGVEALIYALNQGEIRYILANKDLLSTLAKIKSEVPTLEWVICNGTPDGKDLNVITAAGLQIITFKELISRGKENPYDVVPPSAEDLALIMYTSGSTGVPKGVMTSHRNIISAIAGTQGIINILPGDRMLHYLPLAHSMSNMVESNAFYSGTSMAYGSPRTLSDIGVRNCNGDLKECEPHIWIAVPTIFEKVKHGVVGTVNQKGPISKFLFNLSLQHKLRAMKNGSSGKIWDALVFNKVRVKLGVQNLRYMITGSAPLSGDMHDFSRALFGCPLLQGYGLTETCSAGTIQEVDDFSNHKIGLPLHSTEIKLVDVPDMNYLHTDRPCPRGEIWIRGPVITDGYFKNEEKTDEDFTFDEEDDLPYKWFATGDVGQWTEDGFLQIIDRKKNLIKGSHGEYIALEKLEATYKNCSWLDTLVVYIDGLRYHCVLVGVPNRPRLTAWAKQNGLPDEDFGMMCQDPIVINHILKDLQNIARAKDLRSIEVIRAIHLTPNEWTPQNNMLTAAMKLNRGHIVKEFNKEIEALYKAIEK